MELRDRELSVPGYIIKKSPGLGFELKSYSRLSYTLAWARGPDDQMTP